MKRKDKPHIHYCDDTLVHLPIFLGLCTNQKSFNRELKRLTGVKNELPFINNKGGATTHTIEHVEDKHLCVIVCIGKDNKYTKEQTYAMLAHEAVHVWRRIREYIGEKYPSEEFEAYSIQNICQQLFMGYRDSK